MNFNFLGWIESHPGLASWIQGIGTLAAVVIAVWVARNQEEAAERARKADAKQAAKDRDTRQRALAAMIYGELLSAAAKLVEVRESYFPFTTNRACSWHVKTADQLRISEHVTMIGLWPHLIGLEPVTLAAISGVISQIGFFNSLLNKIRVQAFTQGGLSTQINAEHQPINLADDMRQLADLADAILSDMDDIAPKLIRLHPQAERFSDDLFARRAAEMATGS